MSLRQMIKEIKKEEVVEAALLFVFMYFLMLAVYTVGA